MNPIIISWFPIEFDPTCSPKKNWAFISQKGEIFSDGAYLFIYIYASGFSWSLHFIIEVWNLREMPWNALAWKSGFPFRKDFTIHSTYLFWQKMHFRLPKSLNEWLHQRCLIGSMLSLPTLIWQKLISSRAYSWCFV